jgi:hypothetical protein
LLVLFSLFVAGSTAASGWFFLRGGNLLIMGLDVIVVIGGFPWYNILFEFVDLIHDFLGFLGFPVFRKVEV